MTHHLTVVLSIGMVYWYWNNQPSVDFKE